MDHEISKFKDALLRAGAIAEVASQAAVVLVGLLPQPTDDLWTAAVRASLRHAHELLAVEHAELTAAQKTAQMRLRAVQGQLQELQREHQQALAPYGSTKPSGLLRRQATDTAALVERRSQLQQQADDYGRFLLDGSGAARALQTTFRVGQALVKQGVFPPPAGDLTWVNRSRGSGQYDPQLGFFE